MGLLRSAVQCHSRGVGSGPLPSIGRQTPAKKTVAESGASGKKTEVKKKPSMSPGSSQHGSATATSFLDFGLPAALKSRLDSWGRPFEQRLSASYRAWGTAAGVTTSASLWPSTFNIGTDCSGAEAPIWCLRAMGVTFTHVFSCDWSSVVREFITSTSPPKGPIFEDMLKRKTEDVPEFDVYVCGFPCTPYSLLRRHSTKLMREPAAKPFFKVLELLRERAPRLVILENVMGITKVMAKVLKDIKRLGLYTIFVIPIDSKDLGEPVARPRLYFVLVRMDVRVCDDMTKLGNLAEKMCLAARAPVTEHMKTLMLPSTSYVVQQMGRALPRQKKTQATQKTQTTTDATTTDATTCRRCISPCEASARRTIL